MLMVTTPKADSARGAVTPTRGYVPACIRCVGQPADFEIGRGYEVRIRFGQVIAAGWFPFGG